MSQLLADRANDLDFLSSLVKKAEKGGADAADAVLFESMSLEVSYRLGKREDLERSESKDLGLRIFKGKKQAIVSSTDITASSLDELLERGLSMAAAMPPETTPGTPRSTASTSALIRPRCPSVWGFWILLKKRRGFQGY